MDPDSNTPGERRSNGMLRVPFIHQCHLSFDDGTLATAFLVNINILGAYVARNEFPRLGQGVLCRFRIPGNELELTADSVVAWVNTKQQHPVHSLPPGFGLRFQPLSPPVRARIERLIQDYVERHPQFS